MIREDKEVIRGDKQSLSFEIEGDYSEKKIVFVVKANRVIHSSRIIEKKNLIAGGDDEQIETDYDEELDKTFITVWIARANTSSLQSKTYQYDITSEDDDDSEEHYTIFTGKFIIIGDVQTPKDGAVIYNIDTSLIRFVYSADTVKNVISEFSNESADRVYTVIVFIGSSMGDNFVNRPYINYLWMQSGVGWDFNSADITGMNLSNQDFTNADFSNCDLTGVVWKGTIVDGSDFTGATMDISKEDFMNEVGHFNPETTIWVDGQPIGNI